MHRFYLVTIVLLFSLNLGFAQNKNYDSGMPLRVRLKDGNIIKARYMFEEAEVYVLRTDGGAEITVPKDNVVEIDDYSEQKSPKYDLLGDPNYTGMAFETNARPLRQGDAYISSTYGLLNVIGYSPLKGLKLSVSPRVMLGESGFRGLSWGASYSRNIIGKFAMSVGGEYGDGNAYWNRARLLTRATYGGNDANITLGWAVPFRRSHFHENLTFAREYQYMLGGYVRLTERKGLIGEFNHFQRVHNVKNGYRSESEYRGTMALRFHWTTFSFDVGAYSGIHEGSKYHDFFAMPWVSFYYRLKG